MRVLFALPGLHRYDRGAEIAFISVASELARTGDSVTLIGMGQARAGAPYRFLHAGGVSREMFERFPKLPVLRHEYAYEELSFAAGLLSQYRPADYDVTVTCSYPFTNWLLRRPVIRGKRPPHVYVTQNGDWPAQNNDSEYHFFGCEGLVCINPDFYERNQSRWNCALIPNGADCNRFSPGPPRREEFGLPAEGLVVLMVSALIPSKRVEVGVDAVSRITGAHLVVAGNGPMREEIDAEAARKMPGRFTRLSVPSQKMPDLYRSADVFLHLSKDEPFGNVYVEAMATGLPVVAHDSPRSRWIMGDDEFLTDTNDQASVAKQVENARHTSLEQSQKRVVKAAAFSWENIAEKYRAFLHEVIKTKSSFSQTSQ
jgi:glycosyltransferase involved in cell wall biosynthesis